MLKRGADPLALDKNNTDPIMIATENCQPNIVTMYKIKKYIYLKIKIIYLRLRVAKMNNDLKEQDMTYSGDPMFDEILKDLMTLNSKDQFSNDYPSDQSCTSNHHLDNKN